MSKKRLVIYKLTSNEILTFMFFCLSMGISFGILITSNNIHSSMISYITGLISVICVLGTQIKIIDEKRWKKIEYEDKNTDINDIIL
jgi:hypothetical protein